SFFSSVFVRPDAQNVQVTATYNTTGGATVVVGVTANYRTRFMGIMGFSQLPIAVTSTSAWGAGRMRIALVLDHTGSMNEPTGSGTSKMSALKTASHGLLTMLKNAAQSPGDVQVAIIPFNTFVKLDATLFASKPWLSWGLSSGGGGDDSVSGCNGGDGGSDPCTPSSSNWNGCFTDRNQPYDVQNTAPSSTNTNTWFPAVNCSLAQVMPLSYDWTALNSKIDQM